MSDNVYEGSNISNANANTTINESQTQTKQQRQQHIKKRDGRIMTFDQAKITTAIFKSLQASGNPDRQLAESLTDQVINRLLFRGYWNTDNLIPSVEEIQDIVEEELLQGDHAETAKAYVLYRHEREQLRLEKQKILNKDTLDEVDKAFDINALRVLASRYLLKNEKGEITESPKQMFERIAIHMTIPDILHDSSIFTKTQNTPNFTEENDKAIHKYKYQSGDFALKFKIGKYYLNRYHFEGLVRLYDDLDSNGHMRVGIKELLTMFAKGDFADYEKQVKEYYQLMIDRDFLPNTPTLMNSGARLGQLSACFVLPMHDNIESIMKTASDTAFIFKSGGGVGINYSDLRPKGAMVFSTSGVASGPVSFMQIVNTITEVVKQGGKRRGANMGIMDIDHEDIEKFITAKTEPGVLENFNVSVGVYETFWNYLVDGINTDEAKTKHARQLLDIIAHSAWKSAEPGVIFFDNINRHNPMLAVQGPLRATNPCGEQSLYPYESCNLGSINLANFIHENAFDWQRFENVIRITTRFLDNVIDMNKYPVPEIAEATKRTRRIGLGIMGIADLLFKLQIPYASKKGYDLMEEIAESLTLTSMEESIEIAKRRGSFPLFDKSTYKDGDLPIQIPSSTIDETANAWNFLVDSIRDNGLRNSWTTTIAPTGTLSMIAGCSNGVEPVFALSFEKRVTVGSFFYTNQELEAVLKREGLYSDALLKKIIDNYGSVKGLKEIPPRIQDIFVTAMDLHWCDHLMAQAIWQRWISNAIAKTINMPNDVTVEDIKNAYLLAHELGLKGVTVYRDGSRHAQVLHIHSDTKEKNFDVTPSDYVMNHVFANVREPFVRERILSMFEETVPSQTVTIDIDQAVTKEGVRMGYVSDSNIENGESCPECHDQMVVTEGCKLCINCGFSYCSSS